MTKRVKPGDPLGAVAYLRVSTDRQELGSEVQRAEIERWSLRQGIKIVAWFAEEVSGGADLEERPQLLAALAALRDHGAGALVVARRDRLARDPAVAALTERVAQAAGARIVTADGLGNGDTPGDELMRGVLDVVARFERRMIGLRTRAALQKKRTRGERVGALPYGYHLADDGLRLEPDAYEQDVLLQVHDLRREGRTLRAIVAELRIRGVVSRAGRPFWLAQIGRMVHPTSRDKPSLPLP